jgi:hypothetical protein
MRLFQKAQANLKLSFGFFVSCRVPYFCGYFFKTSFKDKFYGEIN